MSTLSSRPPRLTDRASGRRGRRFKSCHPTIIFDNEIISVECASIGTIDIAYSKHHLCNFAPDSLYLCLNIKRRKTSDPNEIDVDVVLGLLASGGAAVPLGIAFVVFAMMAYFEGGGTFGGYGAGPSQPDSWAIAAQICLVRNRSHSRRDSWYLGV